MRKMVETLATLFIETFLPEDPMPEFAGPEFSVFSAAFRVALP